MCNVSGRDTGGAICVLEFTGIRLLIGWSTAVRGSTSGFTGRRLQSDQASPNVFQSLLEDRFELTSIEKVRRKSTDISVGGSQRGPEACFCRARLGVQPADVGIGKRQARQNPPCLPAKPSGPVRSGGNHLPLWNSTGVSQFGRLADLAIGDGPRPRGHGGPRHDWSRRPLSVGYEFGGSQRCNPGEYVRSILGKTPN